MKKINTIIFDYGGTLDTDARHWAHVLFEGYRHAQIPVDEPNFRDAYVYGERALAKAPIVLPDDDFHTVLRLIDNGKWLNERPYHVIHRVARLPHHHGGMNDLTDW